MCQDNLSRGRLNTADLCSLETVDHDRNHSEKLDVYKRQDYSWTMNAWVQAIIWRYKAGLLADPATACAEELLCVYNNLEHTSCLLYTSRCV